MLAFLTARSLRPSTAVRRSPLRLEVLEDRTCPTIIPVIGSAAPLLSFTAQEAAGGMVRLVGTVTDESPGTVSIAFTGVVSGTTTADAQGAFDVTLQATGTGLIQGIATDAEQLSSPALDYYFCSETPALSISSIVWGANRQVTLSGSVTDECPAGREVFFTGAVNGSVITDEAGNFTVTLTASKLGEINASVTDAFGQVGYATSELTNSKPAISDFRVSVEPGGFYVFSGRVTDEFAAGLTVSFGGLAGLQNKTAVVRADGTFSICLRLAEGDYGEAHCSVKDWWDVESDLATTLVI